MQYNSFYMVFAMTLYGVMAWYVIKAMIAGVKSVTKHPQFNRRAFIIGFTVLTIALACWAFNSSGAMVQCMKKHSEVTCRAAIR